MAAPHVAGLVALMASRNPNLTWDQAKTILQNQVTDMGVAGVDSLHGYGLVKAGAAVGAVSVAAPASPVTKMTVELFSDENGNGLIDPGDTLRYVIQVSNPGADPLEGVLVGASLPVGTAYVAGSSRINGVPVKDSTDPAAPFPLADGGGLAIQSVPSMDSHEVSFNVVVADLDVGTYAVDAAVVISSAAGDETLQQSVPLAGSLLQLQAGPLETQIGNQVTYSLTTSYVGSDLLHNVVITTPIPAGMAYVPGSANAGGTESGGVVTWQLGSTLAPQPGSSNLGVSAAAAWPTLVGTGGVITVSHFLSATQPVAALTPTLIFTPSAGVDIAYLSGPTPASPPVDSQGITVTWTFRAAEGTDQIGQVRFAASATVGGQEWPQALSNSVIVHPPLVFQTALESLAPSISVPDTIGNMAYIWDQEGHLVAQISNTTATPIAPALASDLGSRVWWDVNGDGRQDAGEPGIPLVPLRLSDVDGVIVDTTVTDADGRYLFPDRPAGAYTVTVDTVAFEPDGLLAGWTASPAHVGDDNLDSDGDPTTFGASVSLDPGQPALATDFGFYAQTDYSVDQIIHGGSPIRFGSLFSIGLAVTNDGRTWLNNLPVTVDYDPAFMAFQEASLAPDDATDDGSLSWADALAVPDLGAAALGAFEPGQGQEITLTFQAIQDTGVLPDANTHYTITLANPQIDPDGGYGPLDPQVMAGQLVDSGQVEIINPTDVYVLDVGVRTDGESVFLSWRTQDESRMVGFRLLRQGRMGELTWLTPTILPAQHAGQPLGEQYSYLDRLDMGGNPAYVLIILGVDGSQIPVPLGSVAPKGQIFLPLMGQDR